MTEKELLQEALEWREHIAKLAADCSDQELFRKRLATFDWLIKQAERVQELEKQINRYKTGIGGKTMNLAKLFEMQKELDEKILKRFPHLRNEDLLPKKILALQVELGELCNCWRGFKFWSEDQVPRTRVLVNRTTDDIGFKYIGPEHIKNPLLEEYVDALHFILSIGLELDIPEIYGTETKWDELRSVETDITQQFLLVFENVNTLVHAIDWLNLFVDFYILGEMLGFTWEQIEEAYMSKNAENHARQENGY